MTENTDEAAFMGSRVVVMSARPGRIKLAREVPLERPRRYGGNTKPVFAALKAGLTEAVQADEIASQMRSAFGVCRGLWSVALPCTRGQALTKARTAYPSGPVRCYGFGLIDALEGPHTMLSTASTVSAPAARLLPSVARPGGALLLLALALAGGIAGSAQAAVVYNESIGGDLGGNQGDPRVLGSFADGLNTFIGTLQRTNDSPPPGFPSGQGDTFAMWLLPGQTITSARVTTTGGPISNTLTGGVFRGASATPPRTFAVYQRLPSPPTSANVDFSFTLPPIDGDTLVMFSLQWATILNNADARDWKWDIEVVSAVPEPSSYALAGASLAVFGVLSALRRRRARGSTAA